MLYGKLKGEIVMKKSFAVIAALLVLTPCSKMEDKGFSQYAKNNAIEGNKSEFVNAGWDDLGLGSQGRVQQTSRVSL